MEMLLADDHLLFREGSSIKQVADTVIDPKTPGKNGA